MSEDKATVPSELYQAARIEEAVRGHEIGIFETNPNTGDVYWNAELERIFGYEAGTFEGSVGAWLSHVLPSDAPRISESFANAIANKRANLAYAYRMRRRDGEVRFIEGSAQFYYDDAGKHVRRIGVNVDVTDRVAEEARWRALFEQMHEGFVACELLYDDRGTPVDFRFLELNGPAERLTGLSISAVGQRAYELLPGLEKFWLTTYSRVVETGEASNFTHFAAPLGRWFDVHAYRYAKDRFAALFLDITDQKKAEVEVRQAQRALLRTSRLNAMGAMASTLAHELNQPLAAASNFLAVIERLLSASSDPALVQVREAAAAAASSHLRAGDIIKRMKSFALGGRVETTEEDLGAIISAAAAESLSDPAGSGVLLHIRLHEKAPMVRGDRLQLAQVFSNLLKNAVTAMAAQQGPREIMVTSYSNDEFVEISVKDSGPGLSDEQLLRIFEPFRSTTAGMGLGLAICRTIVEAHGGSISARGATGGGAEFIVRLPMTARS